MERIVRLKDLPAYTGYSRSQIYQMIKEHRFPPQRQLGLRAVGWLESELIAWQSGLVAKPGPSPRMMG